MSDCNCCNCSKTKITKDNFNMYCNHANENPYICPCDDDCGCRIWGCCKNKNTKSQIKERQLQPANYDARLDKIEKTLEKLIDMLGYK